MIKKIFITAIVLFILYTLCIIYVIPKSWHASQHQWADNVIKAQNFLYDKSDSVQNVIVGTSLACLIITDSLPHTYNLGFQGQSVYDGLKILLHNVGEVKTIYIESNFIFGKENNTFMASLFSPMYYPRKIFPSLREENHPLAIIGKLLTEWFKNLNYILHGQAYKIGKKDMNENKLVIRPELFNQLLEIKKKSFSQVPTQKTIEDQFNLLRYYVDKFEKQGVKVVFFEMPVNYQLEDLPFLKVTRETLLNKFPLSKYKFIPIPADVKYITSDGFHLTSSEALQYTHLLKSEIR